MTIPRRADHHRGRTPLGNCHPRAPLTEGFFFDTSALVKRHVSEAGSRWVKSLVLAKAAHRLHVAVEVTSAITRRQDFGDVTPAHAGAILGHFRRHQGQPYRVVELTPALLNDAMVAARKHRLRA